MELNSIFVILQLGVLAMSWYPSGAISSPTSQPSVNQGTDFSSAGNEFVVGFARNALFGNIDISLFLYITTMENSPVSFNVTARGTLLYSGVAMNDSTVQVNIDSDLEVQQESQRDHGILVKAEENKTITVYGLSNHQFTSDAYLALPCVSADVDEYEYYAVTYPISAHPALILLVACEDNTIIQSDLTAPIKLNRMETRLIFRTRDLTGQRFVSNKPISFYSGNDCVNVPTDTSFCDHIFEQIPPTLNWGSTFLLASLLGRESGEQIRVVASRPSVVSINCNDSLREYNLTAGGDFIEFFISAGDFCSIEATASVFVAQYASGRIRDGITGDPFLMMIPPIEQYTNNYAVVVLPSFDSSALTLSVAPEFFRPNQIFVNGLTVSSWVDVNCPNGRLCGHIARVNVSDGDYVIYHKNENASVGVLVYGFNPDNSYGYPGGIRLSALQFIDECSINSNVCDINAVCTNETGFDECVCNDGYRGDGFTCTDIDECLADTHNCDENAECTNTVGSFTCDCNDVGYEGNGTVCVADVNECLNGTHNCDENAECTNTVGSFTCDCNDGYMGDGTVCTGVMFGDDPHFSVMLPSNKMLCFSVMGQHNFSYNLISSPRIIMNAIFTPDSKREEVTWIGALGIIAINTSTNSIQTRLKFVANQLTIQIDNKATLSPKRINKIVLQNGQLLVSEYKPRDYPSVLVILKDAGLKFTIKFKREHLDIFWHSTAQQQSNSHGLIGQFFRKGVEIDEVRKILIMPNREPVPVMRRPVWAFMEREEKDDQLCWTAMNLGYQGKGLIEGEHSDYVVSDLLADTFTFGKDIL